MNNMKVLGIVVLYNPEINELLDNIHTYIDCLDELLCIDNTEHLKTYIYKLKEISKVTYIDLRKNKGLAIALNIGCKYACDKGYEWVILLDQDSYYDTNSLQKQLAFIQKGDYSLISPNIKRIYRDNHGKRIFTDELLMKKEVSGEVKFAITSGSLVKISDWKKIGGFDEKLFIMQIDQDYCCNLAKNRLKCYRLPNVFMYQEAGKGVKKKLFGRVVTVPNYDNKRYYYIFRNEFYLRKKWKNAYRAFKVDLWKYIVLIMFEKNRVSKYLAILKGCIDYKALAK